MSSIQNKKLFVPLAALVLMLLSYSLSAEDVTLYSKNHTALKWFDLCPSLKNVVVEDENYLDSSEFIIAYDNELKVHAKYCPSLECRLSSMRSACSQTVANAGIFHFDVSKRYPFLSFLNRAPIPLNYQAPEEGKHYGARIGYIILYHKGLEQLKRMLSAIHHPSNTYVIHVDAKAHDKDEVIALVSSMANVGVMQNSFDITWGGISMVYAQLEGMFTLLDIDPYWDFVINLSAFDYPLCTQEELMGYLSKHTSNNFDNGRVPFRIEEHYWRARAVWLQCGADTLGCYVERIRDPALGVTPYFSSQWFVYTRKFVEFLRYDDFSRRLLLHYEDSWIPDEGYFSTVLLNSKFRDTRIDNNLRYIVMDEIHPYTWIIANLTQLKAQTDTCFARKFDIGYDARVMDALDTWRNPMNRKMFP